MGRVSPGLPVPWLTRSLAAAAAAGDASKDVAVLKLQVNVCWRGVAERQSPAYCNDTFSVASLLSCRRRQRY